MDESEIRRKRLAWIREHKFDKSATAMAERIGTSPSQLGQWLSGHRNISAAKARHVERVCKIKKYWLDGEGGDDPEELSPLARRLGKAFDKLSDEVQNSLFVTLTGQIEDAATGPVPQADHTRLESSRKRVSQKRTSAD